ncbi:MAG TPA: DUF2207 domain-containing protein [Gemmatimonadota bacterium]|nr:DUF2207 domain-containing protein [Gemmatimonadota bacterium]
MTAWWAWVGRDPRPGSIVPAWRAPEGIPPGAAGALVDQRADPADILATILDLAARGYLQIREVHPSGVPAEGGQGARVARSLLESVGLWTTEWEFLRTDKSLDDLVTFERAIVHSLFGAERAVTMSAIAMPFREQLPGLYRSLYDEMVERGWFRQSPQATRREWVILGGVLAAIGGVMVAWLGIVDLGIALLLSGAIFLAFSPAMPVVTRRGAWVRDELLGLREYVRRAEREEVEARHRGEHAPGRFEEILPYAIALGVVDLWLDEFGGLAKGPGWYVVEDAAPPTSFSVSFGVFCTAAVKALGASSR